MLQKFRWKFAPTWVQNKNNLNRKLIFKTISILTFIGDPTKPKSWSKYSEDSTAFKKKNNVESEAIVEEKSKDKKEKKTKKKEKPVDALVKKVG
jgi:hypothetical protein